MEVDLAVQVAAASRPALSERRHDPLSSSREAESASREKPLEEKPLKEKPPEEKPSPASKERAEQSPHPAAEIHNRSCKCSVEFSCSVVVLGSSPCTNELTSMQ